MLGTNGKGMSMKYQNFMTELSSVTPQDSDLPILVMVGDDVVAGDEYRWWSATIEKIKLEKVYYHKEGNTPYAEDICIFYNDGEKPEWWLYDELDNVMGWEEADNLSFEELLEYYENLPWQEVIVIYVGGIVDWDIE